MKNLLKCLYVIINWHDANTTQQDFDYNISHEIKIPFEFIVKIPPPKRTGIDYGFLPSSSVKKKLSKIKKPESLK